MTSAYEVVNATVASVTRGTSVESMTSDLENFPLLMPRWGYVVSAFTLFLIGFFGFFLNLMVILLMFKDRQLWTPLNIILFNLVCSDFSVSVLGNPLTLVSALFHHWVFGHTMCVLYGFFMALLGITSITTLTVISFERYLLVTRPLSSRRLSKRGAALAVLLIWTYSLALTTPPLMGWGSYINEAANISCSINWHEQSLNTLTYILFLFAFGQIVPTAVITFSYINIIRTMKKTSRRLKRVSRAEGRATNMVFIMIVAFTVAWTPYSIFALMEQFATNGIVSPGAGVIPALVAKSSICYNPLIYVGMNTQFRQSIKVIFGIHSQRNNSQVGTMNNARMALPANKLTSSNDTTINLNVSECNTPANARKLNKRVISITDDAIDLTKKETYRPKAKNLTLCTLVESRPGSDDKKPGERFHNDDGYSPVQNKNITESPKLFSDKSPILTIVDSETTSFKKRRVMNIYGNLAYEEHSTDITEENKETDNQVVKRPKIKHSCSLDLIKHSANDRKMKTLSTELKLLGYFDRLPRQHEESLVSIINQSSQKQARFRSYHCVNDSDGSDDNMHIDEIIRKETTFQSYE